MPIRRRKSDTYRRLLARAAQARAGPPGYGMGTAWGGGTLYADAFGAKRGPTPAQLIEGFKQISFAAEQVIVGAMSRLALRLYSASGPGRPKPRSYAEPRTVSRSEMKRLNSLGYLRRSLGGAEDAHEIMSYPLIDTLNKPCVDPETEMSYFDRPSWMGTLVRYVDICGWGWVKPENENGVGLADLVAAAIPPDRLWPLQSQYVWGERETNSAFIKRVKYFNEYYQPNDLLMFRLIPSPRDPYGAGYAPLQAAWQYCQLEDKSISMWDQLLGTGARPNLLISPEDPDKAPGDDERKRFEAELNTYHARGRAGRSLVTTGGWKFTPLNYQGFDLGEMEVNIYLKEMICHCLGVPLSFLSKETNIANLQASRTQLAEQAVEPRAQMLASVLTDLVRKYDDRLFFAFDESIPEDEERKAKIKSSQVKDGIITWNEARLDTPFEPRPDGDQVWVSNSLATTDMLQEKHETGLETAKMTAEAKANPPKPAGGPPPAAEKKTGPTALERRADRVLRMFERELKR
jgi:Phage portal protein